MAEMTQFKSAVAVSSFTAEAAACDEVVDEGVGRLIEEVFAADAGLEAEGALEGASEDVVVCKALGSSRVTCCWRGTLQIPGTSSFGLDKASATKLALPSTYRISVVYSAMHDSWYICLAV